MASEEPSAFGVVELLPSPHLREYVRAFHFTEIHLGAETLFKPLTARPEQMLQFSLRRRFTVIDHRTGEREIAPDVVVVGRRTRRNLDLQATGELAILTVHFQPTGFYRLFHMPLTEITDLSPDAADVIGPGIRKIHDQVVESKSLGAMVRVVERFLQVQIDASRPSHPVQDAATALLRRRDTGALTGLAAQNLLSLRQLERAFLEQVGVGPKRFSSIARFAAALQGKTDHPERTWAEVAAAAGYFDQTHLIRDCRAFGNDTPTSLMETWMDCRP